MNNPDREKVREELKELEEDIMGILDELTVRRILEIWLKENGYEGLCGDECGCEISDLCCCEEDFSQCVPGHKTKCDPENCPADGNCDWHMTPGKNSNLKKAKE